MCKSVRSMKNGFWFSIGFGASLLIVAIAGCFALTEAGLDLLVPETETVALPEPAAVLPETVTTETITIAITIDTPETEPDNFKVACYRLGGQLWTAASDTRDLMGHTVFGDMVCDTTEMQVNIVQAYEHLVHARMFLGKAIHAYGDESFYNAKE